MVEEHAFSVTQMATYCHECKEGVVASALSRSHCEKRWIIDAAVPNDAAQPAKCLPRRHVAAPLKARVTSSVRTGQAMALTR